MYPARIKDRGVFSVDRAFPRTSIIQPPIDVAMSTMVFEPFSSLRCDLASSRRKYAAFSLRLEPPRFLIAFVLMFRSDEFLSPTQEPPRLFSCIDGITRSGSAMGVTLVRECLLRVEIDEVAGFGDSCTESFEFTTDRISAVGPCRVEILPRPPALTLGLWRTFLFCTNSPGPATTGSSSDGLFLVAAKNSEVPAPVAPAEVRYSLPSLAAESVSWGLYRSSSSLCTTHESPRRGSGRSGVPVARCLDMVTKLKQ